MTQTPDPGRTQSHEIEIDGSPEEVWRLLSTSEGITSWFVTRCEVEPGLDGRIHYVWEEMGDMAGDVSIVGWEEGRVLRLKHGPLPGADESSPPVIEEWTIEARGGARCVLRLVSSGIPADPKWDGWYESTERGWRIYLALLRHAAERHAGKVRKAVISMRMVPAARSAIWSGIVGAPGLGLSAEPEVGASVAVHLPGGETTAVVVDCVPGEILVLRLPEAADRVLAFLLHRGAEKSMFWAQVAGFGDDAPDQQRWTEWFASLGPAAE